MQVIESSTQIPSKTRLAAMLVLVLIVAACGPNRPEQVPAEARHNWKGGAAWTYCEQIGYVGTIPLSRCSFYNSDGSEWFPTMNVSLTHLDDVKNSEIIRKELLSWYVTWWEDDPLYNIFRVEHNARTGIVDGEEFQSEHRLTFVADTCLKLLQDNKISELEQLLESQELEINLNNVPAVFSEQLELFLIGLEAPSRVFSSRSVCKVTYYYSAKRLSD